MQRLTSRMFCHGRIHKKGGAFGDLIAVSWFEIHGEFVMKWFGCSDFSYERTVVVVKVGDSSVVGWGRKSDRCLKIVRVGQKKKNKTCRIQESIGPPFHYNKSFFVYFRIPCGLARDTLICTPAMTCIRFCTAKFFFHGTLLMTSINTATTQLLSTHFPSDSTQWSLWQSQKSLEDSTGLWHSRPL